jgi:putative ABC transport system permease protein
MVRNYIKTAVRNLLKYRGFSLINIVGLGFGVACCLLILLFVQDELSYDQYHEKADRIYRVGFDAILNNNASKGVVSCAPIARALVEEFPEVEASTRARNYGYPVFRYGEKVFSEERVFWVDSTFFDVFTVPFLKGDPKTALTKPASIVLTQSMANKYFGDEDPMGKSLNADNRRDYLVTGVVEDVPRNSHFHYDFLASLVTYPIDQDILWVSNNYYTYFALKEGASDKELEEKIQELLIRNAGPQVQQALGITIEQFYAGGGVYRYFLQRLTDIHLHSHLDYEIEPNGNFSYVLIFSIVALGILLVACINFVNLSTARSANRAKEVGIRKTAGSSRGQLIRQFLVETTFLSFLAMIVAVILVYLILPYFSMLADKQLQMSMFASVSNVLAIVGLILFIGLLAGTYPAFFLASFHPVSVLRGEKSRGGRRSVMRSVLVVLQFTISVILIIGTLIVRRQVEYTRTTDLGFNKDDIIIVHKTDDIGQSIRSFKHELLENPNIISVSNTSRLMGQPFGNSVFLKAGGSGEENFLLWRLVTDPDFITTYKIDMVAGRYFEEGREADQQGCVLNEAAVKTLGFDDPVGQELMAPGGGDEIQRVRILGVMRDFHYESMHQVIRPLAVFPFRPDGFSRYLAVRIQPGTAREALASIESTWQQFAQNQAFEYEFFDDHFARVYLAEERTVQILFSFSILAIIIASLGLFGLAAFIAEQRTKEIGIRKVMGATVSGIIVLLVKQFTKWIIIANAIAWPVAYFVMKRWLQNFVYQAPVTIWIFLGSAVVALVIAFVTVSYQSIRAALANPVNSLRYE